MQVIRKGFVKSNIRATASNAMSLEKGSIKSNQSRVYTIDTPTMNTRYVCACMG